MFDIRFVCLSFCNSVFMLFRSILRKNFPDVEEFVDELLLLLFVNVFRFRVHRGPHFVLIILHRETPANLNVMYFMNL